MNIVTRFHLAIALVVLPSCAAEPDESVVQIDSGEFITGETENKVQAVMSIGGCTATAVSDNTLITAGHCVEPGQKVCIRSGTLSNGLCTTDVLVPNGWLRKQFEEDIAVAIFPNGSFKHFFEIQQQPVQRGDNVVMVGYSEYSIGRNDADKGSKRWGRNQIGGFEPGKVIITSYGFSVDKVAVNPGDSGGPMFQGCKLVGIASRTNGYGSFRGKTSLHTNVLTNMSWLQSLQSRGASYCGLSGTDAARCPVSGRAEPIDAVGQKEFPCSESGQEIRPSEKPLYAAVDGSGTHVDLFLAAPENVSSTYLCAGTVPDCSDAEKITFRYQETRDSVRFYKSETKVELGERGGQFTAIGRKASGDITARSTLRFEK